MNRMTNAEAKAKIKKLLMAEIDRLHSHYDIDIEEEVYSDTAEVNELLELNKIVFGALEKQIPKKPMTIKIPAKWGGHDYRCPVCATRVLEQSYCMSCGQAIDSSAIDWSDKDD